MNNCTSLNVILHRAVRANSFWRIRLTHRNARKQRTCKHTATSTMADIIHANDVQQLASRSKRIATCAHHCFLVSISKPFWVTVDWLPSSLHHLLNLASFPCSNSDKAVVIPFLTLKPWVMKQCSSSRNLKNFFLDYRKFDQGDYCIWNV